MRTAVNPTVFGFAVLMCLVLVNGNAATLSYDGGANSPWSTASNWNPDQVPVAGDDLTVAVDRTFLDIDFTVESGRTLNHSNNRLEFSTGGSLTLAEGGTISMVNSRFRFNLNDFVFTIEPNATLTQSGWFLNSSPSFAGAGFTWIADADSVTTWSVDGDFVSIGGLTVDLSTYDPSNGSTLVLVDYGGTQSGAYTSTNVTAGWTGTIDYAYDQGGGDLAIAITGLARTLTWDDGAGDDNWSSASNWDVGGGDPASGPQDGDSVILTTTAQSRLDGSWTIQSGKSLTSLASVFGDELVLESTSDLTLATGGTMDIAFMRPRFSSGGQFTIEPGASLNTDNYGLNNTAATITFEANAAGVSTWNNSGQFQIGSDNLTVDLSSYDIANGTTLVLVDYDGALSGVFASTNLTTGWSGTIDDAYDQGGGDLAIALTGIYRTLTWDDGAGDDNWSSAANWDFAGSDPTSGPQDGDSVVLTTTAQSRLDGSWTIENGKSLTSLTSALGDELVLESGSALTLATGGTMDIGFMRPRFSSGGQFTIEPGASLDTDNYGLGSVSATIALEANASGVTTWNNANQFDVNMDNLTVDLSSYEPSNGDTLILVDYDGSLIGSFASVTLTPGWYGSIDYAYDQGGGDVAIALTGINDGSTVFVFK